MFMGVESGNDAGTHVNDIYATNWELFPCYEMVCLDSGKATNQPDAVEDLLKYATILSQDYYMPGQLFI